MIGQRIRQLRIARGLTLEALAAELGGIVTKQALSKYELGRAQPSPVVLNKLASVFGIKAADLWREPSTRIEFIAYRKGYGLLKRDQERVESLVRETLEERVRLQNMNQGLNGSGLMVKSFTVVKPEEAESAAESLRDQWELGLDPIDNVTGVLEDHLIHVLEIEAGTKFDGIAAVAYGEDNQVAAAAVVTKKDLPGGRQRLNLAHELGHLVLDVDENMDEEQAAFRFAGAFLAPARVVYRVVGKQRTFMPTEELMLLKQRFGMSIQALLYRLRDLGIITESHYRQWCIDINRLGWRKREPSELAQEQPQWLHRMVLRSLAEGIITHQEAERMLGKQLVKAEVPLDLVERRSFMKLPLEDRRRILAEQAERMASYYERDTERADLQGGDLVEY
ncbi:MAG: XRE family transcriptional regulator [Dehalococcoidia bacterium]